MIKDRTQGDEMTQEERWTTEHIDADGHLCVPSEDVLSMSPTREGWTCYWVNTNLSRPYGNVCRVFKYKREEENNVTSSD